MKEVVDRYPGRVIFVSENFGESKLAERFGVTRYPAVFVGEVLVARPRDFGFFAAGETSGRYTPWRDPASHGRFTQDLARMIDLTLAGRTEDLRRERGGEDGPATDTAGPTTLPGLNLLDLAGAPLAGADLAGRVVVVEFWATWCPPCRSTLGWLGTLAGQHGDDLAVVALAVESDEAQVRAVAAVGPPVRWAIATPATALAFGDVVAVPTLFIFDRSGRTAFVSYGAPPDLHARAGKVIESLLEGSDH